MQQPPSTTGNRSMVIWLPNWSIERFQRQQHRSGNPQSTHPLLLIRDQHQRQIVARCCDRANAAGVHPGMALTKARALFENQAIHIQPHDPDRDNAALRSLAVWAQRFSPMVAIDEWIEDGDVSPEGIRADVTGCAHTFGGEHRIARKAIQGLQSLGFTARIAIAPTHGCAHAIARHATTNTSIIDQGQQHKALGTLPVQALRIGNNVAQQLRALGIERIAQLMGLPRSALPVRFGDDLLLRLDQALGMAIEPISPVRPTPPPVVKRIFDGPTDRTDAIEQTVQELLAELVGCLQRQEIGARSVTIDLQRSDLPPECLRIVMGVPTRDRKHMWSLIRPKLERVHLGFGVEAVHITAPSVDRISHTQLTAPQFAESNTCLDEAEASSQAARLLDILGNRLGHQRVLRASIAASYIPERSWRFERATATTASVRTRHAQRPIDQPLSPRPTVLFNHPRPAEVVALTPDGPVHRVRWSGGDHDIAACIGPERIAHEWWQANGSTRDYFRVQTNQGQWLWLARGIEIGLWYVHGVWA